jgi:hypothetical protein
MWKCFFFEGAKWECWIFNFFFSSRNKAKKVLRKRNKAKKKEIVGGAQTIPTSPACELASQVFFACRNGPI